MANTVRPLQSSPTIERRLKLFYVAGMLFTGLVILSTIVLFFVSLNTKNVETKTIIYSQKQQVKGK